VSFGFVRVIDASTQREALARLAQLAGRSMLHPLVRETAFSIISDCASRDDECELEAIFNAVKHGDPRVGPLKKGFKYIADPRSTDYFTAPHRALSSCLRGACGGDCDDHTALICSLAGARRGDGHHGRRVQPGLGAAPWPRHDCLAGVI
jgi:hypothetical protein